MVYDIPNIQHHDNFFTKVTIVHDGKLTTPPPNVRSGTSESYPLRCYWFRSRAEYTERNPPGAAEGIPPNSRPPNPAILHTHNKPQYKHHPTPLTTTHYHMVHHCQQVPNTIYLTPSSSRRFHINSPLSLSQPKTQRTISMISMHSSRSY